MSEKSYPTEKTIFRVEKSKDNPFVMMDRRPLEKPYLSWKAKGLLAYLLSRPDNWVINFGDLVKRSTDGEDATRAAAKELEKAGHVVVTKERDEKGKFVKFSYTVYEQPLPGFPEMDKPDVVQPVLEKPDITNTDSNDSDSNDIADAEELPSVTMRDPEPREPDMEEVKAAAGKTMAGILGQQAGFESAGKEGKAWTYRAKFPENLLPLADKCAAKFGPPSKKDLIGWLTEIGDWYDRGGTVEDFDKAIRLTKGWSSPPVSPYSLTRTISTVIQDRLNEGEPEEQPELEYVDGKPVWR